MEHSHDPAPGLLLVCKHIEDPNVEVLLVDGGEETSVLCEKCMQIDWSKVDWDKQDEVQRKFKEAKIKPGSPEAKDFYAKYGPAELEQLHLACRDCTLEVIASKIKAQENPEIESLGPCRHCGKPILVKHELASGIRRLVMKNQRYNFDVGMSEKEIVITIRKRNSSTVTERAPGE